MSERKAEQGAADSVSAQSVPEIHSAVVPEASNEILCSLQLADISKTISYISRGVELNQPRLIQRAIRQVRQLLILFRQIVDTDTNH